MLLTLLATQTNDSIGSLSATLAGATLVSSGVVENGIDGTLSASLPGATLASAGAIGSGVTGTLTRTLSGATLASAGTIGSGVTGTLTRTLSGAILASAGTVVSNDPTGTLTRTLSNATLASAGVVANGVIGALTLTLSDATMASAGAVVSNDDLDDISDLIEAFAEPIGYTFSPTVGQCRAWWGRQDREVKRVDGARLAYSKRDLLVVREDLPRDPKSGDQFSTDAGNWTVRPRGDDCFTASDRRGKLLRVYVTK
jgi:hypothetical protein